LTFFSVDWILLFKHPWIKKASTAYAKMSRVPVPKLFWAFPKPEFGEHASNNDPILSRPIGDFWQ